MSSPPSKDALQAMANDLECGLVQLENELSDLQTGVQQQLAGAAAVTCAPLASMVAAVDQQLRAQAEQLARQTQALVAAVGMMTDQAAAVVATDMMGAGLESPIAAVTSDLVQDYSACDTTSVPAAVTTSSTCPPVEVHVTCEPCTTPTDTTTYPTDTTAPTDTTPAPPPDEIPPPPEPPPPVDQGECVTYRQCPPDDVSWMGAAGNPDSWLLSDTSQPYQDQLFAALPGQDVAQLFAGMSSVGDMVDYVGGWLAKQLANEYVGDTSPEGQISKQLGG